MAEQVELVTDSTRDTLVTVPGSSELLARIDAPPVFLTGSRASVQASVRTTVGVPVGLACTVIAQDSTDAAVI